jgi:uncharacterized membrane protein
MTNGVGGGIAARAGSAIRSRRERVIQALCFEVLGLAIVSPLFAYVASASTGESLIVLSVLSFAVMCWATLYNTVFDLIEYRCTGRVASDRPHGLRVLHTLGLEVTAALVTWPLIVALTPLGWLEALVADIGLTLAYGLYGYAFHLGFDRLRPVRSDAPGWLQRAEGAAGAADLEPRDRTAPASLGAHVRTPCRGAVRQTRRHHPCRSGGAGSARSKIR